MNFLEKVEKISKDREEGKCFNICGFDFKIRSMQSKIVRNSLLKNKIKNVNSTIEDKDEKKLLSILEKIIIDWDLIDEDTKEKIEVSKENIKKLMLQKNEKGEYRAEVFLWDLFSICVSFDDPKTEVLYKSAKNF